MKYELILTTRNVPFKEDMYMGEIEGNFDDISSIVEYWMNKHGYDSYLLTPKK